MTDDEPTIAVTQKDIERVLRYYRSYYLSRDRKGFLPRAEREQVMSEDSIKFTAEEFFVANASRSQAPRSR